MTESSEFLLRHGAPFLFAVVFLEQIGLPLPALPWLLAAGALGATGKFSLPVGLTLTVLACVAADIFWFYLGRYRGRQVLALLCRVSLEADSCVRRTQNLFTRYGMRSVLVAKFVPGLNTMAPPLAGMSGVRASRFLLVDGAGSLLFGGCFLGLGFVFSNQIQELGTSLGQIGGNVLGLVVGGIALYLAYKYWQRRRLLRALRTARITVEELRQKQNAGENLVILDLRSATELRQEPSLILGAIHMTVDDVEQRHQELPRDRDIIVYCSCPNEVTSARVALLLQRLGLQRVRPLLGGIAAWRAQNYPLAAAPPLAAPAAPAA